MSHVGKMQTAAEDAYASQEPPQLCVARVDEFVGRVTFEMGELMDEPKMSSSDS